MGTEPNVYIARPTHGAGTRPSRTQPPTAARKTTLNAGQCVRQPREGKGRNRQAPPRKEKTGGGGGGGERTAHSHQTARQHHKRRPNPPPRRHQRQVPKEAQGDHPAKTGNTKPGAAARREKGHRNMQTHTTLGKKKEPAAQPEREGMGRQGPLNSPQGPGQGQPTTDTTKPNQDTPKKKSAKNTPRQPNQEGQGTAETRAQHARLHTAPQPGKAGNKRGARTKTQPRTANPTRRCRRPRGTGARAHTHPNTPPRGGRTQPKPKTLARTPTPHTGTGNSGGQAERARNHTRPICRPKPKPNHEHHKQLAKEGQHHKLYPNIPAQGPSQDWRG